MSTHWPVCVSQYVVAGQSLCWVHAIGVHVLRAGSQVVPAGQGYPGEHVCDAVHRPVALSQMSPMGQFTSAVHDGPWPAGMHVERESHTCPVGQSVSLEQTFVSMHVPSGPQ